jgi:PST family polysaccharide transporter
MNFFKKIVNTSEKKRLLENYFSLLFLQGANFILPLLTLPYLVRVLGTEKFGLVMFAQAFIVFFNIVVDFGFNLSATREISIHRDDHKKVIEIFSSVMSIKLFLMFFSLIILTILVFSFEKLSNHWEVYFLTFGTVVGQVLFPIWFFQGMERMKYITYLNIVAKIIFTVAIFVFVKDQNDFYLVPFFTSLGFIAVGIWSLWIIFKEFGIGFRVQSFERLKYYLLDGWYLFKTRIFVSIYTVTNIFLLGLMTNNMVVGYYSISERIITAIGGLFIPANQAIYPFMTKLYEESRDRFIKFLRKISLIYISMSLSLFVLMYFFSNTIIVLVNGTMNSNISSIYFILVFLIFTAPFGTLYAQVMVTESKNKKISEIVRDIAVLNMIFVPIGIYFWGAVGMALVVVLLQYFIVLKYYITINKGM